MEDERSRPGPPTTRVVLLSSKERQELEGILRRGTVEQRQALRARMVLLRADGVAVEEIARRLAIDRNTVRRWCDRFRNRRMEGLADRPRSGRPPSLSLRASASR